MGIVNVTPDSFSDGGAYNAVADAVSAGRQMVADGAVIVDVGGESTRPGARPVSLAVELERVVGVVEGLVDAGVCVSVDTSKAAVAQAAIESGAAAINDVTGLENPAMLSICADAGVGVVIMHKKGSPETMQTDPRYDDVVDEVSEYLSRRSEIAMQSGISRDAIAIDPGIGFGKTFDHNIALVSHLDTMVRLGFPVVLGTSRKGFLGQILEPIRGRTEPAERDGATAATIALAVEAGVRILRVHNVRLAVEVAHTAKAMVRHDGKETDRS